MSNDWAAVARAINERSNQLGLKQRELAEKAQVAQAIVREIQNHRVERKRSRRTLEALSAALEWHPGHLAAVLEGRRPPKPGETGNPAVDAVVDRLDAIETRLQDIADRLDEINARMADTGRDDPPRDAR